MRRSSPELFWEEICSLKERHGIDRIFETADIFPLNALNPLIKAKPTGLGGVKLRCYLFPGMLTERKADELAEIGMSEVFVGVENVKYYADSIHYDPIGNRKMRVKFTKRELIKEIRRFGRSGILVMPSMVLGLKGETHSSLEENLTLARELDDLPNIKEMSLNIVMPLPGSEYFRTYHSRKIRSLYESYTGKDLTRDDNLDYLAFSKAFIDEYSDVQREDIEDGIRDFMVSAKSCVAHWGL